MNNPIEHHFPVIDLDQFLRHYIDAHRSPAAIADALGVPVQTLLDYVAQPEVAQYVDAIERFTRQRLPIVAGGAVEQILRDLDGLPKLPANPAPADVDRRRRDLDAARRAADLLRKLYFPPPATRTHSRHAAAASPLPAPVPTTPEPLSGSCPSPSMPPSMLPPMLPCMPLPTGTTRPPRTTPAQNLRQLAGCA